MNDFFDYFCTINNQKNKTHTGKTGIYLMTKKEAVKLFEEKKVRTVWGEEQEKWYFSVVDVVAILTDSPNPQAYWRVLKKRLIAEGNETVTDCNGFKMRAADGKMRTTDVANTEQLFRIIQSIPSPKAEPFKRKIALC
jgi:hypothetical protein